MELPILLAFTLHIGLDLCLVPTMALGFLNCCGKEVDVHAGSSKDDLVEPARKAEPRKGRSSDSKSAKLPAVKATLGP